MEWLWPASIGIRLLEFSINDVASGSPQGLKIDCLGLFALVISLTVFRLALKQLCCMGQTNVNVKWNFL